MTQAGPVLILDDDPDIINFLTHEFKKHKITVDPANDIDQALILLQKRSYLCAIVDIVLGPNKTSEKIIQFLKEGSIESARKTPLIITSAFMNPQYAKKIEERGINVYKAVPKPFRPGQISKIIQQLHADLKSGLFTPIDPKVLSETSPSSSHDIKGIDDRLVHVEEVREQHKVNIAVMAQDDLNYKNEEGESSLMIFCLKTKAELVEKLLVLGANPNHLAQSGQTAVHYAVLGGNKEILTMLIGAGANINVVDNNQHDPLFLAIKKNDYIMADILISHGAKLDNKVEGNSYLFWAMQLGQLSIFNRLLAAGADPKVRNVAGKDLKQIAREGNKKHFMRVLGTLDI
ncbi:MAG: ankyrin repeat domain-containing protein [Bdellovibrio sp.]|nr:ankyrin repeat domain-containing protein [Bdellovibrio sp.]